MEKDARKYIKDHASEFQVEGVDGEPVEDEGPTPDTENISGPDGESNVTTNETVGEAKSKRHDDEQSVLQHGLDGIGTGVSTIVGGVMSLFDFLGETFKDLPMSKETALVGLVLVLLASNLYTYFALKNGRSATQDERAARRASRLGTGTPSARIDTSADLSEERITRAIETYFLGKVSSTKTVEAQVMELHSLLETIELRAMALQKHLGKGRAESVEDLDSLE